MAAELRGSALVTGGERSPLGSALDPDDAGFTLPG
jgi:hypothetical protein